MFDPWHARFEFKCCSIYLVVSSFVLDYLVYRVSGLSCPEAGGCKWAILRGFLDVFSLFGPWMVGAISFRYSWTTGMKKKFRNLIPKKSQISGLVQIDIFSDFLVLGVANFRINYLRQFSFNLKNSCAHLAEFPEFFKTYPTFYIWMVLKKVMDK